MAVTEATCSSRLNSLPNEIKDIIVRYCDPRAARELSLVNKSFREAVRAHGFESVANAEHDHDSLVALEVILRLNTPPRAWTLAWEIQPERVDRLVEKLLPGVPPLEDFQGLVGYWRVRELTSAPETPLSTSKFFRMAALLLHRRGECLERDMMAVAAEAARAGDVQSLEIFLESTTQTSDVAYAALEAAVDSVPPQCHIIDWMCTSTPRTAHMREAINLVLVHLCGKNDIELTQRFVDEFGADPTDYDNYAIRFASRNGHASVVQLLLADSRVDPTAGDNFAIRWASKNGHTSVVQLLLADSRVDPTADDNYAIRWASKNGYASVVQLLLADSRVDPTAGDNHAIRFASQNGFVSMVQLLLADSRVDPTALDNIAIRWASWFGHASVVQVLLADSRVDPTAVDNSAIKCASENGHASVVQLLLADSRVDPTAGDNYAIRFASRRGHASVVQLLLADSRVNPSDKDNSAIHWASGNGHASVVRLLLADGRLSLTADDIRKARRQAARNHRDDVVQLLRMNC